jgi:hypothetical protein
VCGGGGGAAPSRGTDWAGGTHAYAFAGYHIGVKLNSDETANLLDRLFASQVVDDPRAPDNYSVALYPTGGKTRELNLLVRGSQQLARSRSARRILEGLLSFLTADLSPIDADLLPLRVTAAVREGEAALVPALPTSWLPDILPRLARKGIQLVDAATPAVRPETNELVVAEYAVPYDAEVLATVDGDAKLGSELPSVRPGRYTLRTWAMGTSALEEGLTQSMRVAAAAPLIVGTRETLEANLERLIGLLDQVEVTGISYEDAATAAKSIAATLT